MVVTCNVTLSIILLF